MGNVATDARRWMRALGAVLSLSVALSAAPSLAQTSEELAAARQTFNEGKDLEKQRSWADALVKFRKVAGVKMTPQVRFHIALCEENLGNLVSAMKGFQLAAEEARQAGSTAAEVAEKAPVRAEALRKRVGTLKINVSGKVIASKVFLDAVPLAAASFGSEIHVDPGTHTIEVQDASGKKTFHKDLAIGEQGSEQVNVEINDSEPPPPPSATAPPPSSAPPEPPPPPPPSRAPAYAVGGVGLAFLLAAGGLFAATQITIANVKNTCDDPINPNGGCERNLQAEADQGRLYLLLSEISLGVGAAGVLTSTILFITLAPKKSAPPKAAVTIAPAGPGIVIRGVF